MINRYQECRVVIIMLTPMKMMVMLDHENEDMITSSSPIWLTVGGNAGFRLASSHPVAMNGRNISKARAGITVRL